MRIISGNHRGKKIVAPPNFEVRPTTDFAKESLFNILNNYFNFEAVHVLDLFAGTGNISYEFAARNALSVMAVDNQTSCIEFIKRTSGQLGFDQQIKCVKSDAITFLQHCRTPFDIIFADPPYTWTSYDVIVDEILGNNLLSSNGFLIIEHPAAIDFSQEPKFFQQRHYGKVNFSFFAQNL